MLVREMTEADIAFVLSMYIDYYNNHEGSCWNEETAGRRIRQVLHMDGACCLVMEDDFAVVGFALGYFKQYDDVIGYTLDEIVIAYEYQNQGLGSQFLQRIEATVKEKNASCVELQAVNDEMHEHFYGKSGYHNAKNFVMKVKWFE